MECNLLNEILEKKYCLQTDKLILDDAENV